jgi:2-polyprenyl-3-methyl-5-hydroxy-6-metoxy-1,4-benzoquinol methylase
MNDQNIFWDNMSKEYISSNPAFLEEFRKYVPLHSTILDIGCGYGRVLGELKDIGYTDITGIDFSNKMVERAKSKNPEINIEFMETTSSDLLKNKKFDAIILFDMLTCNHLDTDINNILEYVSEHLKDRGILYVCDFLLMDDQRNLKRYEKYCKKYNIYGVFEIEGGGVLRHFEEKYFKELFNNYEPLWEYNYSFPSMRGNKTKRIRLILRKTK